MKRGAIWVSAVLYIAVGVVILSLLLSTLLPLIEKIKDRNTFIQTKDLLLTIDETITTVAREGPGSQRELSPLTISKGALFVNDSAENFGWEMKTSANILEAGSMIQEGVLNLSAIAAPAEGVTILRAYRGYAGIYDLQLQTAYSSPFQGKYSLVVKHTGNFTSTSQPVIALILS